MQIEVADVARKIRLDEFTSGKEKITNKILLCFFFMLSFAPNMFSNMHTSINAFLGKGSSALQLCFEEES